MRSLLFDIDRTILDTDKMSLLLTENILQVLETTNIEKIKNIKEKYHQSLKNDREYDPEIALKLIAQEFKFTDMQKLLDVYFGKEFEHLYSGSVYPETFEVIEKLKDKFAFGIYSEGTDKFQNHKFRSMGISEYFNEDLIFIVPAKDTSDVVSKIPKEAVIVDDKETSCEFLYKNGIKCIWLNKKDNRKSERFTTIHNLLDLPNIL